MNAKILVKICGNCSKVYEDHEPYSDAFRCYTIGTKLFRLWGTDNPDVYAIPQGRILEAISFLRDYYKDYSLTTEFIVVRPIVTQPAATTKPQCKCDIKTLLSTGHEANCEYRSNR